MKQYTIRHTEDFNQFIKDENIKDVIIRAWHQFRCCQAWLGDAILYYPNGSKRAYIIQSYETIVAVYIMDTQEFIRLSRYSRTTSKQCTQIENALRWGGCL